MSDTVQVVLQYGYVVLFAWALAKQIGLPIPSCMTTRFESIPGGNDGN